MSALPDPAEHAVSAAFGAPQATVELFLLLRAESDPRFAMESALRAAGGRVVWSARGERLVIGEGELHWSHFALVQGPSERALLDALRRIARAAGLLEVASRRFRRQRLPALARVFLAVVRFVGRRRRHDEPDPTTLEIPAGLAPSPINPPLTRLREIAADRSAAPAFLINLLGFRERAEYPEGTRRADVSGRTAYRRYGVVAARSIALLGGAIEHMGRLDAAVADRAGLATSGVWDELAIVRYPRPRSLVQLERMPGYARALVHRNAGLLRTALILSR